MAKTHALYRFYSDAGHLLYVGITSNPGARFAQHQSDKPWWHDVSGISVEKYGSREEAMAAEARAIAVESPRHNLSRPGINKKRATNARAALGLTWHCDACEKPVRDGSGYLHVNDAEVAKCHQEHEAFRKRHTSDLGLVITGDAWREFFDLPEPVKWQVHHASCDPDPDAGDYWFGVERARTHAHLLDWTAHLMEKSWLEHTDWSELISRMAGVDA